MLNSILLVGLGSACGGILRFLLSTWFRWWIGGSFPWGTLSVNGLGCFAIGVLYSLTEHTLARHLIGVGILGGFTTFSSFSVETLALLQEKRLGAALAYVGLSMAGCLVLVWFGWLVGDALKRLGAAS